MQNSFQQRRKGVLTGLAASEDDYRDKSRKGSVDVRALPVIQAINAREDMYTTSSCSGRISVFAEPTEETRLAGKKGGEWVYASHDPADEEEVLRCLHARHGSGAQLVFRFEPFLLHAECVDMAAANTLLNAARLAGFRESGATQGSSAHTRIMVGVRCALRLEVPVADGGSMLVSEDYIRYLVRLANHKFELNTARILRLKEYLMAAPGPTAITPKQKSGKRAARPAAGETATQGVSITAQAGTQLVDTDNNSSGMSHGLVGVPNGHTHVPKGPSHVLSGDSHVVLHQPSSVKHASGAVRRPRALKGVDAALHTPLQTLRVRQVALLQRLAALQAHLTSSQQQLTPSQRQFDTQAADVVKSSNAVKSSDAVQLTDAVKSSNAAKSLIAAKPAHAVEISDTAHRKRRSGTRAGVGKVIQAPAAQPLVLQCVPAKLPICAMHREASAQMTHEATQETLAWKPMPLLGHDQKVPLATLLRWGAASVMWNGRLVVVGGYGGAGTHARRADILLCQAVETKTAGSSSTDGVGFKWRVLEPPAGSPTPCPRMGHALTLIGDCAVLVGGRASPASPLNDVWLLHLPTVTWTEVHATTLHALSNNSNSPVTASNATGGVGSSTTRPATWPGRYRHTAVAVPAAATSSSTMGVTQLSAISNPQPTCVYVFGGRSDEEVLDDLWVLVPPCELSDTGLNSNVQASQPPSKGWYWVQVPQSTIGHSSQGNESAASSKAESTVNADSAQGADSSSTHGACWPSPRKSHAAVAVQGQMYLYGGMASYGSHQHDMYRLDVPAVQQYVCACLASSRPQAPSCFWHAVQAPCSDSITPHGLGDTLTEPPACMSHSLILLPGARHLVLLGGHPTTLHDWLHIYDTATQQWTRCKTVHPDIHDVSCIPTASWLPIRHCAGLFTLTHQQPSSPPCAASTNQCQSTASANRVQLIIMGGGAFCFSFGSVFSGPFVCDITHVMGELPGAYGNGSLLNDAPTVNQTAVRDSPGGMGPLISTQQTHLANGGAAACVGHSSPERSRTAQEAVASSAAGGSPHTDATVPTTDWMLQVPALRARAVKNALKVVGWLDRRRKAGELTRLGAQGLVTSSGFSATETVVAAHDANGARGALPSDAAGARVTSGSTVVVVLPLMPAAVQPLLAAAASSHSLAQQGPIASKSTDDGQQQSEICTHAALNSSDGHQQSGISMQTAMEYYDAEQQSGVTQGIASVPTEVIQALQHGASLVQLATAVNRKAVQDPHKHLYHAVQAILPRTATPATVQQLLADLPKKWEKLGNDLVLVPEDCLRHKQWAVCFSTEAAKRQLYMVIAASLGASRLARQAPIANTGTRDSQAQLLCGEDGWVHHKEHGVTYVLDVTRCMYSSGNVTERVRMGRLAAEGEVVVDMFTGIGYYTLPLLVNAHASKVYACEWNPAALECLHKGLAANSVQSRCEVRAGDCREVAPVRVAHRVLLGLLPHSNLAWPAAVAALRDDTGGWLHVHNNVLDSDEARWIADMVTELQRLCDITPGRAGWQVTVHHVERVKWYAPRIRHIVCDVQLVPPGRPAAAVGSAAQQSVPVLPTSGQQQSQQGPGTNIVSSSKTGRSGTSRQAGMEGTPTQSGTERKTSSNGTAGNSINQSERAMRCRHVNSGSVPAQQHMQAAGEASTQPVSTPWFKRPVHELPQVQVIDGITPEMFTTQVDPARAPVLLTGLDLGPAVHKWNATYLANLPGGYNPQVSVHVTRDPNGALDFVHKNFVYRTMPWRELIERISGQGTRHPPILPADTQPTVNAHPTPAHKCGVASSRASETAQHGKACPTPAGQTGCGPTGQLCGRELYYLRCLGDNPRKDAANMQHAFPSLWADLQLPALFPKHALFSSVLRISSPGLQLWTHFDVMDNLLIQVKGVKRVLLWPPLSAPDLYIQGSSSHVINLAEPDVHKYPRLVHAVPQVVDLHPGQVLFIPALWHHQVTTLTSQQLQSTHPANAGVREMCEDDGWSVSVNVFWRHLPAHFYDPKDVYGNKDLVQAALASKAVQEAAQHLMALPEPYHSFYTQQCVQHLTSKFPMQSRQ